MDNEEDVAVGHFGHYGHYGNFGIMDIMNILIISLILIISEMSHFQVRKKIFKKTTSSNAKAFGTSANKYISY